jgi:AcrR family transcriptional regulator
MSGKRPYRLGKRAASVADTKRRILEAANAEYAENGIEDTSMQAVARRADVAPGTVLYHYPTPEDLADAVVETWIDEIGMPTTDDIDSGADLQTRIRTLIGLLYEMYESSEWAYKIYQKSPNHPSLVKSNQMWEENLGAMLFKAIGERAMDPEAVQVVSVLIDPGFRGTLLSRGMSPERAVEAATQMTLDWLH